MRTFRLVLIGFGNVGQGFAEILRDRGDLIADREGVRLSIVAVCDLLKGSVADPSGIDPAALLASVAETGRLERVRTPVSGWDALETIRSSDADVVVELSYTDLATGEPALTHVRAALDAGRHVVTTNKGPVAHGWAQLLGLAAERGVEIGVEGTVMSGTPAIRLATESLAEAGIRGVEGILNGTTNFILTRMETGLSFVEALTEAQARGLAEADPTGDVEGFDAAGKLVILASLLFDASLRMDEIDREGITSLTPRDIAIARSNGQRWKLVAKLEREGATLRASVRPAALSLDHPLAGVPAAMNAITFNTDLLGPVTLFGPGAGRVETGYAVLGDLLAIARRTAARPTAPAPSNAILEAVR
jgi:homoserine dehydrogenase